jgi:hypothetical protein
MQAENRKASNAAAKIASLDIILADLFIRVLVGIYLYSIPPVKLHKWAQPRQSVKLPGCWERMVQIWIIRAYLPAC